MTAAIYFLYVVDCFFLIMVVLLQAGRGGGLAGLGGGSSAQVFGARGAVTFLQKLTIGAAAVFMVLSMVLAYLSSSPSTASAGQVVLDEPAQTAPATPGEAAGDEAAPAAPSEGQGGTEAAGEPPSEAPASSGEDDDSAE